ncbi:MAG: hypothetical protein R3F56_22760 [Planctomycetota bacterium]
MLSRLLRWVFLVAGGALLGAGLFLYGQVAVAGYMRTEVRNTFFLWRGIGRVSFVFQDGQTKMALWLNELDASVLDRSRHAATVMLTLGGLLVLVAPWMHCGRRPRARQATD